MPSRSPIAAAMLNPALLAAVAAATANGYAQAAEGALMPWSYSFLAAPFVLHRDTRNALPTTIATHMPTWLERHTALRIGYPNRAQTLVGAVAEGLRFGLRCGALSVVDGELVRSNLTAPTRAVLDKATHEATNGLGLDLGPGTDLAEIVTKARFIGRWLTKLDTPATAYALLGVTP
jgi:hypothetical protein